MLARRPSATVPDDRPRLIFAMTLREVAERLDLPLTTVASIEQRALRKLATCEELKEDWEERKAAVEVELIENPAEETR